MEFEINENVKTVRIRTSRCKTCAAVIGRVGNPIQFQWVHILFAKEKINCDDPIPKNS